MCQDLPTDLGAVDRYSAAISNQEAAMNTFTLLTALGAFGTIGSFFHQASPSAGGSPNAALRAIVSNAHEKLFGLCVALTILAAPLAG
jgi:hypothetical protein